MYCVSDDEFDRMVECALDAMPPEFMDALDNVVIMVQDEPTEEEFALLDDEGYPHTSRDGEELLGLYDGINITQRGITYDMSAPDMITLFKGPHERTANSEQELQHEVHRTLIHEIGHYFGLDDARLHEMGY